MAGKPLVAKLGRPVKGKSGRSIVPVIYPKLPPSKAKRRSTVGAPLPAPNLDCGCVPVSMTDGAIVNYDGNIIIVPIPQTGGPWVLAYNPDGTTTWVNAN